MATEVSRPVHPGEILQQEFLMVLGITPVELASALKVSPAAVRGLLGRRRKISADIALRLGRYFNTSARFWMNLQTEYSLAVSFAACGQEIEQQVIPLPLVPAGLATRIRNRFSVVDGFSVDDEPNIPEGKN